MRIELEVIRVCAYCSKKIKPKRKTCGNWACQWKHHIMLMRKNRKTTSQRPSRRLF